MTMTTTSTVPMLENHPAPIGIDRVQLGAAIDTIIMCSEACTMCADACLSEEMVGQLKTCITLNLDCADICAMHADMHEHCRVCTEACNRSERACRELLAALR